MSLNHKEEDERRRGGGGVEGSAPSQGCDATKIKKQNWSTRSESVLHENNNTAATVEQQARLVWLRPHFFFFFPLHPVRSDRPVS